MHTVEPVYKDHPGEPEEIVCVDKWSPRIGVVCS